MKLEMCPSCEEPIVEGRFNCIKCGSVYPDLNERELTWNPSKGEEQESEEDR
jgi:hypothetical protein